MSVRTLIPEVMKPRARSYHGDLSKGEHSKLVETDMTAHTLKFFADCDRYYAANPGHELTTRRLLRKSRK